MAPIATSPTRWLLLAMAWLLLLTLALLAGESWTVRWLGHLNVHGHAQLYPHGHPFADARSFLGVPNAADTLSNAAFLLPGLLGLFCLFAGTHQPAGLRLPRTLRAGLALFLTGLLATAVGSSVYHAWPSGLTLVLDRSGMALAFAGLLTAATAEHLGERLAAWMLALGLPLALLAAALPALNGNVLPWLGVQGGGVVWLLGLAARQARPVVGLGLPLGAVVAGYGLAKVLEGADAAVFAATGHGVSGHTLKHLVAAGAAWPVVVALNRARRAQPGGSPERR